MTTPRRPEHWRALGPEWFARWQPWLIALLAEPVIGRLLRRILRILPDDVGYRGRIVRLLPHAYVVQNDNGSLTADIRTHWKFSKRLYHAFLPLWWTAHAWDWAIADRLPKGGPLPDLSFGFSVLTAYPDADPESTTVDGRTARGEVNEAWATIQAGAGNSANDANALDHFAGYVATATTNQWSHLYRSIFLFDTSALTSNAILTAAVLSLYVTFKNDQASAAPNLDIYTSAPASSTGLVVADFTTLGTTSQTGSPIAYSSVTTGAYNDFTFNATGRGNISLTGVSKFGARNANHDVAAVAPTWSSGATSNFEGQFADTSGTSQDPKLVITYTISSPSASISPSTSLSPSPSASPSRSPSASTSPSSSRSPSVSASASLSPSASTSPSSSFSPTLSASMSASASRSPSTSLSPSVSASRSASASLSPSASTSPSSSRSPSASTSASTSPSSSTSASLSASASASPSPDVPSELDSATVELYLNGVWTDVLADTVATEGLSLRYGIWDHGPLAHVASTGSCAFVLRNDPSNSGGVTGYYSPGHTNCRPGFTRGMRCRVRFTFDGTTYTKFYGKVYEINPQPGLYTAKRTRVVALDWMDELANFDVREVVPQVNKRADELITAIINAMPTDAQPVGTSLDVGIDTFPYAFDDIGSGANGLALVKDVVMSEWGFFGARGDGTAVFHDRQSLLTATTQLTLTDDQLMDLRVPGSLASVYNVVRTISHPKRLDTGNVVLWTKATSDVPSVTSGQTITIWVTYRNPNNEDQLIGGQSGQFVTPVASTDYVANTQADGLGSNITADVTVTATFFATTAKLEIENVNAATAYLTTLQIRGRGIYDLAAVTYESSSTQAYGRRVLDVDMPYQNNANIAQDLATYLRAQFDALERQVEEVAFNPQQDDTLMLAALAREPGDRITLSETVTGLTSVDLRINGVELTLSPRLWLTCRWSVAPAFVTDAWILDDPIWSILDDTTVLGAV